MKSLKNMAKKYNFENPMYCDHAMYVHEHNNFEERQRNFYGTIKSHLGKNHNKSELRVLINGVFQAIRNI